MKRRRLICSTAVIVFLFFNSGAFAGGVEEEIQALKARISELESKVEELEAGRGKLPQDAAADVKKQVDEHMLRREAGDEFLDGLRLGLGATFIVQGTIGANNTSKKREDVTNPSFSVDLEFEKEFGDFGRAFLHLETGDGAGAEDELELYSNVNRDADPSGGTVSATEIWYEHYLFDKQLAVMFGKIDPTVLVDQNAVAHDECAQFLSRIFVNAPTIPFPENAAGIRGFLALEDAPWFELEGYVVDGDSNWADIADHIFTAWQINFKPALIPGREGNYRFYGWFKNTNHTKWSDAAKMFEENYGFGISADQGIADALTLFGRYGWANPHVYDPNITSSSGVNYSIEHTWSAGFRLDGALWGRENDHFGAALGMVIPSDKYRNASSDRKADDEGHVELYYSWHVNDHLTLSPDVQIIWNPFGNDHIVNGERRKDTVYILGTRGQVDF